MESEKAVRRVPIRELVRYYLRLGSIGFGGPVALVGQMERELVGERKWLTKEEMREGIAVCQSLPGPLAIQVGIWISYIRGGFWGAWAGGWAFILPNFVIVTVLGALYVHFGGLSAVKAVFYGVSPAVIALILHSCYRLTKLGMKDWLEWLLAAAAFVITVAVQAEVALLFIGCGIVGVLYYGSLFRKRTSSSTTTTLMAGLPLVATAPGTAGAMLGKLFTFFLKAGSSFLLILIVAPILMHYRTNLNVQGFIKGAYAAAIGTILGACVLLGRIAIGDWLTALVALVSLIVLFRWKVSNPLLVAAAAVIGLIAFPLLRPEWTFVK